MQRRTSGWTTCLAWLPRPSRWTGVATRLRQLGEASGRSGLPVRIVVAVGEEVDLGPRVRTVRCDQFAGAAWPLMSRIARYHLLAAALPAGTERIVLRMPGAADPSLPEFLGRWGSLTVSEHHGDEIAERLREGRGLTGLLRAGAEAAGLRVLLRGVAGALGVTPEIAGILARRGPSGLATGWTGNGVDVSGVPSTGCRRYSGGCLDVVAVLGNAAPWHGLDRLLSGMATHTGEGIRLHLIGDPSSIGYIPGNASVVHHGHLSGPALDTVLRDAHIGIASLAMHRAGLVQACPLKSREYAARGLPFAYAYDDPDLPPNLPWCLRLPPGDGTLDIEGLHRFAANLPDDASVRLRAFATQHLDWAVSLARMHTQASRMTV